MKEYTVKQLAKLANISVRTLHYYDEIDLLKPSVVRENGYRYYGNQELVKLQQILFFKELEFPLAEIKKMLTAPNYSSLEALNDQQHLLEMKKVRIDGLINTIKKTINNLKGGEKMNNDDLFDSFDEQEIEKYKKEAQQKWGHTDAYKQSVQRTKGWTKTDYKRVKAEGEALARQIANAMDKGLKDPEVQALVTKHYNAIAQFYDLPYEMYRNLGKMYVQDQRFTAYYERFRPGLAQFLCDAIAYYCDTQKKDLGNS